MLEFQFFHILDSSCFFLIIDIFMFKVLSYCAFDFISLMTNNVEHFFHVFIGHLYIFWGEMFIQILYLF